MAEPRPRRPGTADTAARRARGRSRLAVAAVGLAVLGLVAGHRPLAARAASPAPSRPPQLATVEAWLDATFIVPDAPPGGMLEAGVTFWDTAKHDFAPLEGVYGRLRPNVGKAAASEGTVTATIPRVPTA